VTKKIATATTTRKIPPTTIPAIWPGVRTASTGVVSVYVLESPATAFAGSAQVTCKPAQQYSPDLGQSALFEHGFPQLLNASVQLEPHLTVLSEATDPEFDFGGGGFGFGGGGFGFGGGGGDQRGQMKKGADLQVPLEVTLEDLYLGKTMRVAHKKQVLCNHCRGSGAEKPDDVETCPVCKGKGIRIVTQQLGPGFVQQIQTQCDKCGGKGQTVKSVCHRCKGRKVELSSEALTLIIERGMIDGQTIVFKQESDEAPDTQPGDLIFVISTVAHPTFVRRGNDLHMKTTISLLEALVGFSKEIKHLDGHIVTISSSNVVIPGQIMRIENEGMPVHDYPSIRGSLYVEFSIQFPPNHSEDQKKVFKLMLKE